MRNPLRFALLGGLAIGLATAGQLHAQTTPGTTPVTPGTTPVTPLAPAAPPVVTGPGTPSTTATPRTDMGRPDTTRTDTTRTDTTRSGAARTDSDDRQVVDAAMLEEGANSFTEGQTRSRLENAGFSAIEGLRKDERGFWRGQAMRAGKVGEVAMDFRGRIAAGPDLANLGQGARGTTSGSTTGTTTGTTMGTTRTPDPSATVPSTPIPSITGVRPDASRPDGTPGNPPSTAVGRAVDRAQGDVPRPDGTPGNPAGTAAGRALDGATGSNTTGTNPPPATR